MDRADSLQTGDRLKLSGGYDFEPEWLDGRDCVSGVVVAFMPGQNDTPAAVIRLDAPMTYKDVTGDIVVLELRYVGVDWAPTGIVHVELCDFMPETSPWRDRKKGKWVESHASYNQLIA